MRPRSYDARLPDWVRVEMTMGPKWVHRWDGRSWTERGAVLADCGDDKEWFRTDEYLDGRAAVNCPGCLWLMENASGPSCSPPPGQSPPGPGTPRT